MKKRWFMMLVVLVIAAMLLPAAAGAEDVPAPTGSLLDAQGSARLERVESRISSDPASGMRVSIAPQTGVARFAWLASEQAARIKAQAGDRAGFENQAGLFFAEYGRVFGIRDAAAELVLVGTKTDSLGTSHLSYAQVYQGVPVFAGILRLHFDAHGLLKSANGMFIPDVNLDTTPGLSAAAAVSAAESEVNLPGAQALRSTLYVYRQNLARGIPGSNRLAYEVEMSDGQSVHEFVYVDAHTGEVIDRLPGTNEALERVIYNQVYDRAAVIWQEGDDLPFYSEDLRDEINRDVNRLINYAGDTYEMVANTTSGAYLSYDGESAPMLQIVDDQTPDFCPNASWNGQVARFCEGITGDDTVAHEWGHAYTQYTSGLVYVWQPGALNESYSDIFGEVVDYINGEGLDEPGGLRTDGACSEYTPLPVSLHVSAPEAIAGDYDAGFASFGPRVDGLLQGSLMIVDDGTGDTSTEGCNPLVNDLTGKIAFIRRGTCTFAVKVKNAQDAGAIGAIVANHLAGGDETITMFGYDPTITIQSLFIGYTDGNTIQAAIESGEDVQVRFDLIQPTITPDNSYRWLSGEDDYGGAIRDLWNPSCYGDPDKVTSEDYTCSTANADRGGVHTNSGVPNHAFALLVDGGNFNGENINGIGLTKAFHIYWRAQYIYQVTTSTFADHADALQQSCADLVGAELADLAAGGPSGEIVEQPDCVELGKVVDAVELYEDPVCSGSQNATYQHRIRVDD